MKNKMEFEPVLSNFLDESFSNGSGDKPKTSKPKKVKSTKSDRSDKTYVGRGRDESGSSRDVADGGVGGNKSKLTAEQIQQGVDIATQVGGAISQLPKNKSKQDLKAACGRRPLLKKNRASWDKCVADYTQTKNQPTESVSTESNTYTPPTPEVEEKKFYQKPLFIVGVSVVVLVGGFFAYKYFKKTPELKPVTVS